jgi:hypothetical protein
VIFDQILTSEIGQYRSREQSRSRIKTTINKWFKRHYPSWQADEIQHLVLRHQDAFIVAINSACNITMNFEASEALAVARAKRRTTTNWEAPISELVSGEKSESAGPGYLYTPDLVDVKRSNPERLFERWAQAQVETGQVLWWWKNGVGDERYLGVNYNWPSDQDAKEGKDGPGANEYITYPDYVLQSADKTTWVLEVKDADDPDGAVGGRTKAKAVGLQAWQQLMMTARQNSGSLLEMGAVRAGVVIPEELPTGKVLLRIGNSKAWIEPSKANLAIGEGWEPLNI